jgi:hypothetical protein
MTTDAPFTGYEKLDEKDVVRVLRDHSQVELEAVETYERSHQNRLPVLDKLRFMRQSEPFEGYDALESKEIVVALDDADLVTVKRVRGYERKFADRPAVLEQAARIHRERRAAKPAAAAPSYQPMSASSGSRASP